MCEAARRRNVQGRRRWIWKRWRAFLALWIVPAALAACATQKTFSSPEEGTASFVEAVRLDDEPMLRAILGSEGTVLIRSGDAVADERARTAFLEAYDEKNHLEQEGDGSTRLVVGQNKWPMPIPLVKTSAGWQFDTASGEQEILARRIGRNELATIQVCLAIVDAAHEYAIRDPDGNGMPEYPAKFVSTPGKRDGLYWPAKPDEPQSPLGPLLAAATSEGYTDAVSRPLAPYHGYFYRILTQQGHAATGGTHDYIVKGHMIGGFAVMAYPAEYGVSGIMTFLVNQDGILYEKNLGEHTSAIALRMMSFNPDAGWSRVARAENR